MSLFSQRLKELRKSAGFTLTAVSKMLGISHVSYFNWEQGKTEPCINSIHKLCLIFDVSSDYLLGIENEDGTRAALPFIK